MVEIVHEIEILKELSEFIVPLNDEEFSQLEKNILIEGCKEPLSVWPRPNGQNVLVDGHNRFRICQKHNLPFKTRKIDFASLGEAKLWMVNNQMGRRNLTPDQSSYYRGLKYNSLKKQKGGYESVKRKATKSKATSQVISEKFNVSESTIKRDAKFAEGLDIIGTTNPKLKNKILSGEVRVKKSDVQTLADAKNPGKIVIKNEADLYNKAKNIRDEILDEVERSIKGVSEKIEKAQKVLNDTEPLFLKKDDRIRKIKGMIVSLINRAINKKDITAIKELRRLVDRLGDEIFE